MEDPLAASSDLNDDDYFKNLSKKKKNIYIYTVEFFFLFFHVFSNSMFFPIYYIPDIPFPKMKGKKMLPRSETRAEFLIKIHRCLFLITRYPGG